MAKNDRKKQESLSALNIIENSSSSETESNFAGKLRKQLISAAETSTTLENTQQISQKIGQKIDHTRNK